METHPTKNSDWIPFSFSQYAIWESFMKNLPWQTWNVGAYLDVGFYLNPARFSESIRTVLAQSDSLCSQVVYREGKPGTQLGVEASTFDIPVISEYLNQPGEALQWVEKAFERGFDLSSKNPLIKMALLQISECRWIWVVHAHHLIIDLHGLFIFIQNVFHHYHHQELFLRPQTSFSDYIYSELAYRENERYRKDQAYWQTRLGEKPVFHLPIPWAPNATPRNHRQSITLSTELVQAISEKATQLDLSPYLFWVTLLTLFLAKRYHQPLVVLGINIHNRVQKKYRHLMANLSLTQPFYLPVAPECSLLNFVKDLSAAWSADLRHYRFPYQLIFPGYQPFDVVFSYAMETGYESHDPSSPYSGHEYPGPCLSVPLTINFYRFQKHMPAKLDLECHGHYFNALTAEIISRQLEGFLLNFLSATPESLISQIHIPAESSLCSEISIPNGNIQLMPAIWKLLLERSSKPALFIDHQAISYGQLAVLVGTVIQKLREYSLPPQTPIATLLPKSPLLIASLLAIWHENHIFVPIDPSYPRARITLLLEESACRLVLTQDLLLLSSLDTPSSPFSLRIPVPGLEDFAYLIFSSGSTGIPKKTLIRHQALESVFQSWYSYYTLSQPQRVLSISSPAFDTFIGDFVKAFASGGSLIFPGSTLDPLHLRASLALDQPTLIEGIPSYLYALLDQADIPPTLRVLILGAEACSINLFQSLRALLPSTVRLVNGYGTTETCIESIVFEGEPAPYSHEIQLVPIGKALPHGKALILDPEDRLCPIGQIGEIVLQGPHIPSGQAIYKTGDLGRYLHDGNIEWVGRKDDQVNQAGIRIEPDEISRLIERINTVLEAVTVQLSFPPAQHLASMVLIHDSSKLSISDIRAYLKTVLPHSLIPQRIQLVTALPRNAHGKVDRNTVRNQLASSLPHPDEPFDNPMEESLASLLKSVWPVTSFEREDDLIDLGLDSLTIIRWLHLLAQNHLKVDMATIYSARSIRCLGEHLSGSGVHQMPSETPKPALSDFPSQAHQLLARIYTMEKKQQQLLLSSRVTEEWADTLLGKEFTHFFPHHYFLDYVSLHCSEEILASRLATLFEHQTILRSSLQTDELAVYHVYERSPGLHDVLVSVTEWGMSELKDFIGEVLFPYLGHPAKGLSILPARWFVFAHGTDRYTVVWALLESIHDQFGSALIRHYLSGGTTHAPPVSLLTHYNQLTKGPRDLSDSELSEMFELERFSHLCQELSVSWDYPLTTSLDGSVDFMISIPPTVDVFAFALGLFSEYVHCFTQQIQIPALFMTDTRQFDPSPLKTLIGDFTDYTPFILDYSKNPDLNAASLHLKRDRCAQRRVHFRSLCFENHLSFLYPKSHSLIRKSLGEKLSLRHPFVFHFRAQGDSSHEIGLERHTAHPYLSWTEGGYFECSLQGKALHIQGTYPFEVSSDQVQRSLESRMEILSRDRV